MLHRWVKSRAGRLALCAGVLLVAITGWFGYQRDPRAGPLPAAIPAMAEPSVRATARVEDPSPILSPPINGAAQPASLADRVEVSHAPSSESIPERPVVLRGRIESSRSDLERASVV